MPLGPFSLSALWIFLLWVAALGRQTILMLEISCADASQLWPNGDLLWVCTELRSSLTDWNYFLKRLEDWFLLPKLSDVLQFVDDFEVIRITGVTCKCGWGFMNSKFVDETSCLNYGKFSRRVEINSSTFFCLPSTFFTWQLKLPKEAELDWQDSSGDCCFHSLLPYVQRQHLEVLKEEQVSVLYFFRCGSEKFSVSDWAMKLQCNYFKNQGDHM